MSNSVDNHFTQTVIMFISRLSSLSSDSPGQLDVFGHDGDTLGVDSAQVGIFEETDKIRFRSFLQSHNSRALESQVSLEILSDFPHQPLERQLSDEELSALLVTTDLSESDCSWPVSVRLLHSSGGRGTLTSSLRRQLLPGSFTSSRLTGSLLGTSHS
jgi:hypothetical protein